MSTKVALSPALCARIQSLGWPGDVKRLKNYYWADKLREALEKLFPDAQRPLFDDPDWPWSGGSPAEAQRNADEMHRQRLASPPTENQQQILVFFLGSNHGINSFGEASHRIDQLLSDPENKARWELHNNNIPATERQVERLEWASARLHRPLPKPLTKAKAHELIDAWFDEFPDLQLEWYEEKDRRAESEMELEVVANEVDDWRDFYSCKPVTHSAVQSVLKSIGSRKNGESLDRFMVRFFAALRRQQPVLFSGQPTNTNTSNPSKTGGVGCLVVLFGSFFVFVLFMLLAIVTAKM